MAYCILGPPTLSTFPASMCSLRATWADEAIAHKSKTQAEKAKFGAQKGQVSCSRAVHGAVSYDSQRESSRRVFLALQFR